MASLAASTAAASIGVSEILGNFSVASRPAPSASSPVTFKTVALFGKKKAAPPPKKAVAVTPASDELAKWYGRCLRDSLYHCLTKLLSKLFRFFITKEKMLLSGPERRIFLPEGLLDRSEVPEYLTGEVPGE